MVIFFALSVGLLDVLFDKLYAIYSEGGQGGDRLLLFKNAIKAFGESPVFGLGFGHHSGIDGVMEGMEAHNLYLDCVVIGLESVG